MGKVYDAIMGLVIGDALGVPFEFKKRDTFKANDMVGYGTYDQPPGTWSDDSSMTLATLESLIRRGKIDVYDIMENFRSWFLYGCFTPYGNTFDIGNTTRRAILKFSNGFAPELCGGNDIMDNGNGSLMRILPLVFVDKLGMGKIRDVSSLTHAHKISIDACEIYLEYALSLIIGEEKHDALRTIFILPNFYLKEFDRIKDIANLKREEIKSTGYVVDTLEAALWCLLTTDNYKDCVLTAVNLGDDTDTVAAIVGGLAGILYGVGGEKGIPEEWISQIARREWIEDLCDQFEARFLRD